jgi:uncharacterized protein YecE (DUF72 family)
MPEVSIGCSGFNYPHWRRVFYPEGLSQRKWFQHYCTVFSSVELNVTFYRLPAPGTCEKWYRETHHDFAFSLKGSRFVTHIKRLEDVGGPLELFFDRASHLREKLKVVLWQFPPSFQVNVRRLSRFLDLISHFRVRNTLEFRHESWITNEIVTLCMEHGIALCMADWPHFIDSLPVTADFIYMRRHGEGGRYDTCYSKAALKRDARRVKGFLKDGKDVFIYFNNDASGYAPGNAQQLIALI